MFKRKKGIVRRLRNLWYDFLGENCCYGCGDTWSVNSDRPAIVYGKTLNDGAMSPLCRKCFDRLDVTEIMYYCNEVVRLWRSYGSEVRWSEIKQPLRDAVHRMKGEA